PVVPQEPGHVVLGPPVDLQVGMERPELVRDRDVPASVTQADRRTDVQRAFAPALPSGPRTFAGDGWMDTVHESPDEQVELDGVTTERVVARALQHHQLAAGDGAGQLDAAGRAGDGV